MEMKMDKEQIKRIFGNTVCEQMMTDDMYYVNTKKVSFNYDGEFKEIENVTYLCFMDNYVYFNDVHKFDMNKMNGSFMISTEPSDTIHPAVKAFAKVSAMISAFGLPL